MRVPIGKHHLLLLLSFSLFSCGQDEPAPPPTDSCAPSTLNSISGSEGFAMVFAPDPAASSGDMNLTPSSLKLDDYRSAVTLLRLGGHGVLEGQYVDVRNGLKCSEWFGAHDSRNQFSYSHNDFRFQEAMSYYYGDQYRAKLDAAGYLEPRQPVRIIAHCMLEDNAFFVRRRADDGSVIPTVCLGDSAVTRGASYGDDAIVTVHELQHATTVDLYTVGDLYEDLNQFWYDEAGALNEAISDFMGLVYTAPLLGPSLDPKVFGRWALDRFYPNQSGTRGAHKCPLYVKNCMDFLPFSAKNNSISYVYPDGLGWPYADNYQGVSPLRVAYSTYPAQEEIHNAGVLMEGALWDVYESIQASYGGNVEKAEMLSMKLVLESIRHLDRPTSAHRSPVTFRSFASTLLKTGRELELGLGPKDMDIIEKALAARGLVGGAWLDSKWAAPGDGKGMKVFDSPTDLKVWMARMGVDPNRITHGIDTGLNGKLDPGEIAVIWFDLKNVSETTAGGVELDVILPSGAGVVFLNKDVNAGYFEDLRAQIRYGKINGTGVVNALNNSANSSDNVPISNSYFSTNRFFERSWFTALWVKVSPQASRGIPFNIRVRATPSNGEASSVDFPVTIN